jgi:hypothetical protein
MTRPRGLEDGASAASRGEGMGGGGLTIPRGTGFRWLDTAGGATGISGAAAVEVGGGALSVERDGGVAEVGSIRGEVTEQR